MVLGQMIQQGLFTNTYKSLGQTNGDSPRSWAGVIRPNRTPEDNYGQLYMNSAGLLVGIRYDHKAYLAYDTKTGEFSGHGKIEKLSPFVLLDEGVSINPKDVDSIIQDQKEERDIGPGIPQAKHMQKALDSSNPEIRKIAARILQARGIEVPATK